MESIYLKRYDQHNGGGKASARASNQRQQSICQRREGQPSIRQTTMT
jgi:hypothetical protein